MYCNICKRNDFKNEHGLNIHKAKAHGIRKQHESAHPPRERHTTATTRSDETKTASRPTASHEGKTHTTNPRGQVHSHTSNDVVRQSAMIVQMEAIQKCPLLGNHFKGPADVYPQRTKTPSGARKPETPKKPHSATKDGHRTKTPGTPHSADTRTPSSTGTDFGGVRPKTPRGARKPDTPKKPHSATKDDHRTKTPGTPHSADTRTPSSTGTDFGGVRPKTPRGARKPETPKKPHSATKDGHRTKKPWTPHSADTRTPSSTDFFICPICDGKSFKYEGWYIKHMENKHPGCAFGVVAKGREDDKSDQEKRDSWKRREDSVDDRPSSVVSSQENHHTSNDIVRQSAMIVQNEAILKSPLLGNHFKGPADIHPQRTQTSSVASKPETPKKPHSTTKDGHRTKTPWTPHSADTRTPSSTGTDFGGVRPKTPRGARKPGTPKKPHSATKDGHRTKTPGTPHSADTRTLNPTGMDFAGVRPKTPRGARKPDTPKKPHSTTKDGHRTKTPGTLHSADTMTPSSTGTDFEGVRPKTSSGARKQETPKKSHSTTKDGHRTKTPGKPHSADTGTPSSTGTDFEGVRPKTSSGARKQETPKKSHSTTKDGHRTKTPGTPHSADTGTPSSTDSFICPKCDGKSYKSKGWYIKHMEKKHPGCPFGVVAKGREEDKSDQEKCDSWIKREDSVDDRPSSVVSRLFKQAMFDLFEKSLSDGTFREGRRTTRQTSKPGSPAYTIFYDLGIYNKPPIDVDLVPAIRIEGWPKPAKEIKPDWVKKETTDRATRRFHAVMKTYPENWPDGDLLWRISFTHAEKELILHANEKEKGCRKDIFKLLKKIKEVMRNSNDIEKFCSYHLKMFMLKFFDKQKYFGNEMKVDLLKKAIKKLVESVEHGIIPNYFIPEDNVIVNVPEKERTLIVKELRRLLEGSLVMTS
uniref:Muscle M-line assembly protein unc-89-like isoform X3 n=1 Tax=Crassostrea virginica TaxID=6565 RepID=A0A8B8BNR8_CRAVI|nr:muscle M-line assembly protein unc-89-like isoform X3 [Crassostrea virginica]